MTTSVDIPPSKYDVVDAHGNYHDVSKSAFDSTSLDGHFASLVERGGKWLHENFSETFSRLQQKAGVKLTGYSSGSLKIAARKVASQVAGHFAAKAAGAAAGTIATLNPLVGLAVGEAIEAGLDLFETTLSRWAPVTYKRGEWIAIDNGWRKRHINEKPQRQVLESGMFGPNLMRDTEYHRTRDISFGFVLGPGIDQNHIRVFNFRWGRPDTLDAVKLRQLPEKNRAELDGNKELSMIREVWFLDESRVSNRAKYDPGDEVIYQGKVAHVLEANDRTLRIEGRDGNRVQVCAVDVTPGRRKHGKTATAEFETLGDVLHAGQWVWLPAEAVEKRVDPKAQRLLAVVDRLEGHLAYCISALDGAVRATIPTKPVPLSENATAGLERHKAFRNFKLAVTQGRNTRRLAPGRRFILTVLGHDTVGQMHTRRARRRMPGVPSRGVKAGFGEETYEGEGEPGSLCLVPLGPSEAAMNRELTRLDDSAEQNMALAVVNKETAMATAEGEKHDPGDVGSNTTMFVVFGIGAVAVLFMLR